MKKTLTAVLTTLIIFTASTPARATYYDVAYYASVANQNLALAHYYGEYALHYSDEYGYDDYSGMYNAYLSALAAMDNALYAYYYAPVNSNAEYYALQAYLYLSDLSTSLYYNYVYGGYYLYTTNAIEYAYISQLYLSFAMETAAGNY